MLGLFLPNEYVDSIFEINSDELKEKGIKGVVVDLDNTLVPWNVRSATDEIITWLNEMEQANIKVTIFSNNNEERVSFFCKPLNTPFVAKAKKPLRRAFNEARRAMGLNQNEMAVIGDQLLTDVLGGNRSGLYTILVKPIVSTDAPITKFNRRIERFILNRFYRTGQLVRRETDE